MIPRTKHVTSRSSAQPDIANLSVPQLQQQLKDYWVRTERAIKEEMAPRLYHLREKLKRQGSRTGEGFAVWVKANLGLSLSTVNRWANEYAVQDGLKTPRNGTARAATSSQMNRSDGEPPDGEQFQLSFAWSAEKQEQFCKAQALLGDERTEQIIFDAVTRAADEVAKKKPQRASKQPKRGKEWVQ